MGHGSTARTCRRTALHRKGTTAHSSFGRRAERSPISYRPHAFQHRFANGGAPAVSAQRDPIPVGSLPGPCRRMTELLRGAYPQSFLSFQLCVSPGRLYARLLYTASQHAVVWSLINCTRTGFPAVWLSGSVGRVTPLPFTLTPALPAAPVFSLIKVTPSVLDRTLLVVPSLLR